MSSMKWKTAIRYQVSDMVKPLTIYYIILYGIVGLIQIITRFYNGDTGFSGLEMSSMIFLFFCGVYAFLEDFRFFIQNGLTRKNIFKSQMLLFLFVAVLMGSLELIVENSFVFQEEHQSVFQTVYGYEYSIGIEWIWRICLYLMIVNLAFLSTIIQNRIGKRPFLLILITLILVCVMLLPAVNVWMDGRLAAAVFPFLLKLVGVTKDGIHILYPFVTFLGISLISMGISFLLFRRAEVK